MNKKIISFAILAIAALLIFAFGGQKFLSFLPIVAAAAIVDSVNFCAFSVLLLTIAFLFSVGKERLGIVKMGGFYIAGMFLMYFLIGLGIMKTLSFFGAPHFIAKIGAVVLIILGLIDIINEFFPAFPIKLKIPAAAHQKIATLMQKGSAPAMFLLGAFIGLAEFPCTGGPYLTILGLLHDRATYASGVAYLLFYNVVFIAPLVVILAIASNKKLLEKIQLWQQTKTIRIKFLSGIAMVVLGIVIFMI